MDSQDLLGSLRIYPGLSRALRGLIGTLNFLRDSQVLSGALRASQGLSRALKGSQGPSRSLRDSQDISGVLLGLSEALKGF